MNALSNFATPARRRIFRASLAALIAANLATACSPEATVSGAPTTAATAIPDNPAAPGPNLDTSAPGTSSTPLPTPTMPDLKPVADGVVALAPGEEADVAPGSKLRFDRIVNDSRCPAGVQCVWAGEVRIALVLTTPGGVDSFELSEHENKTSRHSLQIELLSFGDCPAGKPAAVLGQECASLKVSAGAVE